MIQKPGRQVITSSLAGVLSLLSAASIIIVLSRLSDETANSTLGVDPSIILPLLTTISLFSVAGPLIVALVDRRERLLLLGAWIFAMAGMGNAVLTSPLLGGTAHFPFSITGIALGLLLCIYRVLLASERTRSRPTTNRL
ncbi:hypothetical protein [Mycetocola sp. JXN-3]|uniref:hypothetical protein n=1 Tax=Mycetocola sp. JXN-3 TaxID=2116510 RepID=UPI00165D2C6E|nr:hypothetical protein [Mycetocola sp. JXN-3]